MFASIMDGMKAQRERSTTNRREAAKLFNEHLKNQSDLGIEVTEQSLSDAWDSNSGGVLRKHAPTQQRLQSIVTAQNKSLAEKKAADDFEQIKNSNTMRGYIIEARDEAFASATMPESGVFEDGDYDKIYNSIYESLPEGLREQYSTMSNQGRNTGKEYTSYRNKKIGEVATQIKLLGKSNIFDVETVQTFFPNTPRSIIESILASQEADREQVVTGYEQANATYERGVITWEGQQVTLKRQEQEAVTAAARLLVIQSRDDKDYEMKLAKAEKDIARELITDRQKDIEFKQGVLTYNFDFEEATKAAAQKILDQGYADVERGRKTTREDLAASQLEKTITQEDTVFDQAQEMVMPERIEKAMVRGGIDASVKNGTASLESITEIMNLYNVTDDKIIKRIWQQSQTIMNQATDIEMQEYNKGNAGKRAAGILDVDKYMANLKTNTNKEIGNYFPKVSDTIGSAITIIANKYQFAPNAYVGAFSDWINSKVKDGTFGKDVDQTVIIAAMSAEIENPQDSRVKLMSQNMKPSTYSSLKQSLLAQKTKAIGVDRYTTDSYKKILIKDTQAELDAYLMGMEFAIQNGDINKFQDNQTAIADLVLEMNADMGVRESDFKTAFGPRVTLDEAQEVMGEMKKILEKALSSSGNMTAPIPPPTKVAYLFPDDLFMGTGTLKNVAQGLSMVNGKIASFPKSSTTTGGGQSTEEMKAYAAKKELEGAQATFDEYKSQTDDLQNQKDALNQNQAFEKKALHDQILAIAEKARNLHSRIGTIMADLEP